ncbi:nuclear transport factor 2 family protein [Nonomuraea sp. FMUSA5-5]|uniref:Nuclear transport factor 2 family protein n=1 Tax=Nonomuraea composti TaxID=2720023 RepID=A0ABX1BBC2_9ACTN|nr:nuclear transport factor 2 family protein [Nonomuraea sp. FMUSA5-5]NJP93644.1 nuclear transport factor 2 family protein [Nonomuraea sp. FMUSA5-5]
MLELGPGHEIDLRQFGVGREELPPMRLDNPISQEYGPAENGDQEHRDADRLRRILHGEFGHECDRDGGAHEAEQQQLLPRARLGALPATSVPLRHRFLPKVGADGEYER